MTTTPLGARIPDPAQKRAAAPVHGSGTRGDRQADRDPLSARQAPICNITTFTFSPDNSPPRTELRVHPAVWRNRGRLEEAGAEPARLRPSNGPVASKRLGPHRLISRRSRRVRRLTSTLPCCEKIAWAKHRDSAPGIQVLAGPRRPRLSPPRRRPGPARDSDCPSCPGSPAPRPQVQPKQRRHSATQGSPGAGHQSARARTLAWPGPARSPRTLVSTKLSHP